MCLYFGCHIGAAKIFFAAESRNSPQRGILRVISIFDGDDVESVSPKTRRRTFQIDVGGYRYGRGHDIFSYAVYGIDKSGFSACVAKLGCIRLKPA